MIENPTEQQFRTLKGIVYLIFNKINRKYYIGNTIRTFRKRYSGPFWWNYCNIYLTRAINKYGVENFSISILEHSILNQKKLNQKEKFYSEMYNSIVPNGYNLRECGGNHGKQHPLSVHKRTKFYTFINPEGKIVTFRNMKKFCQENKLFDTAMWKVLHDIVPHHKQWTKYEKDSANLGFLDKCIKYIIKSPTGEIINIQNFAKFCRDNKLCNRGMFALVSGKLSRYKGYSLIENKRNPNIKPLPYKEPGKTITLIDPNGEKVIIHNVAKFCKNHNLNPFSLCKVQTGFLETYCGFKNPDPRPFIKYREKENQKNQIKRLATEQILLKTLISIIRIKSFYAGVAPDSSPGLFCEITV